MDRKSRVESKREKKCRYILVTKIVLTLLYKAKTFFLNVDPSLLVCLW
jgi:hypothetical protein